MVRGTEQLGILGRIFDHVASNLKCRNQWWQLNFFACTTKKSLLEFSQFDQEVNPDILW